MMYQCLLVSFNSHLYTIVGELILLFSFTLCTPRIFQLYHLYLITAYSKYLYMSLPYWSPVYMHWNIHNQSFAGFLSHLMVGWSSSSSTFLKKGLWKLFSFSLDTRRIAWVDTEFLVHASFPWFKKKNAAPLLPCLVFYFLKG